VLAAGEVVAGLVHAQDEHERQRELQEAAEQEAGAGQRQQRALGAVALVAEPGVLVAEHGERTGQRRRDPRRQEQRPVHPFPSVGAAGLGEDVEDAFAALFTDRGGVAVGLGLREHGVETVLDLAFLLVYEVGADRTVLVGFVGGEVLADGVLDLLGHTLVSGGVDAILEPFGGSGHRGRPPAGPVKSVSARQALAATRPPVGHPTPPDRLRDK
jgi:hypothetical protein